jgi:hypothetical protein
VSVESVRILDEIRRAQSIVNRLVESRLTPSTVQGLRHLEFAAQALEDAEKALQGKKRRQPRRPYHGSAAEGNR